jgi:hypothetical protein
VTFLIVAFVGGTQAYANNNRNDCLEKIQRQGQILLVINKKIMAMPPLSSIYVSTNSVWRQAISEKDMGNHRECNRLLDISIKHSSPYAR